MPAANPTARPAAANSGQRGREREETGVFRSLLNQLPIMILIWVGTQWITKNLKSQSPPAPVAMANDAGPVASVSPSNAPTAPQDFNTVPLWPLNTLLDVHLSLVSSSVAVAWPTKTFRGIRWGDWDWSETWETEWDVPEAISAHNQSVWMEVTVTKAGQVPDSHSLDTYRKRKLITRYLPLRRDRKVKNLLKSDNGTNADDEEEELGPPPIVSHYHPNLTFGIVSETPVLALNKLPPVLTQHIDLVPGRPKSLEGHYLRYPTVFPNDFWLLREHMTPLNSTITKLPLLVTLYPLSTMRFQLLASMGDAFEKQATAHGGTGGSELDEIKRMLTETSPWLLATTLTVSLLHALFEFLAFSSDVKHWRGKKEFVGVSIRTILVNIAVQTIVLLYLLDNSEGTSWMILMGQGVGLLIEAWKITKAVDIHVHHGQGLGGVLPRIEVTDKHILSEDEKKTQEYDALAFRYVSWVTIPCLAGYTVYSLMYESHRGWYSFVISTLTSFTYAFGFVQLVPQLIINYKLKSVAHLPMKTLIYKTLTTVVDDFFSFVIKMPTLHRLACFRDDVVFVILLYQYWIYRIDYTRVNEYGQGGDQPEKDGEESRKDR